MRVVFLDADGVMNSELGELKEASQGLYAEENIKWLNELVRLTNCKICFTSTHRLGLTIPEIQDYFNEMGFIGECIAATPHIGYCCRGEEIAHVLDTLWPGLSTRQWIIIDDEIYDLSPLQVARTVQCEGNLGFTGESLKIALYLYGEPY